MAYFKLEAPTEIIRYPVDYHSHFTGILPVQGKDGADAPLSLAGLLTDCLYGGDGRRGELELFDLALGFMMDPGSNPFARLLKNGNRAQYERAECAAENVYVASVLLARMFGYLPVDALGEPAAASFLYGAVRKQVVAEALAGAGAPDEGLMKIVRYFNGKIYSANKYTPFDDCYKMRGAFVKRFCGGDPADYAKWKGDPDRYRMQLDRYGRWITATFDYLRQDGVTHTQTAATEDEIPALAEAAGAYNRKNSTSYKLLVHTPHQYLPDGMLRDYLTRKVLPLLTDDKVDIVGLDLLGAENKVGNYRELFEFLRLHQDRLKGQFGPDKPRSRKLITHIHCGEGSGFGADNRSMIGYYMYEVGDPDAQFHQDLAGYILSCHHAAEARLLDTPRGTAGTATPFGLFDELFRNNSLTFRGRLLRRFDISSEKSRELTAYNAKRNVMALSETFDGRPEGASDTWYELLTGRGTPFAIRLGHDYYYRSYMASRYPEIAFDTNLGSNAITGASGLFNSIEGYRINRGFRHLDGYIDTNVLQAAGDAVAYMSSEALDRDQIARFTRMSAEDGSLDDVLKQNAAWIGEQLQAALGPIYDDVNKDAFLEEYCSLVSKLVADVDSGAYRYQAMVRVLALFQNWRSYLLGADGQGAEHTNVQREFLRMLILLAYGLLPTGLTRIGVDVMLALQYTVRRVAKEYWRSTIGPTEFEVVADTHDLQRLDGFKAPGSVVTVRRSAARR